MTDVRPGTSKTSRIKLYDKSLELRAISGATIALATTATVTTGIEFPGRQQLVFKAVFQAGSYASTSSNTHTLGIQMATSSSTSATGTIVASYTVPTAGGERELYLGGKEIEAVVGSFASVSDPLYIRAYTVASATNNLTALDYSCFLTAAV